MSNVKYLVLICDSNGMIKTKSAIKASKINFPFESEDFDGCKLWVSGPVDFNSLSLLDVKLPKKTSRGYVICNNNETEIIAGLDGALEENIFNVNYLFTTGLKVIENKRVAVEEILMDSKNAFLKTADFLKSAEVTIGDGIVSYRLDVHPSANVSHLGKIITDPIYNSAISDEDYFYAGYNRSSKVVTSGGLDSMLGAYCGPNAIITFTLPSGEEGAVNNDEGLIWF